MDAAAVDHQKEGNLPFVGALQREIGDVEAGGNDLRDPGQTFRVPVPAFLQIPTPGPWSAIDRCIRRQPYSAKADWIFYPVG